ncbi:MAG: ABC transporter ATP-binding protein, partial [Candidatus Staskawiczbacteria bacterium]|nr:ABC transporter ATP-binding protein [Candidatus Staskawiczbacteria bacterium]
IISLYYLFKKGYGNYKIRIAAMVFLSFVGSVMEGIGLTMLVPLLSLVSQEGSANQGEIYKVMVGVFAFFGIGFSIKNLLLVICVLFLVKAVVQFFSGYVNTHIITSFELDNKKEVFKMTMKANWSYLSKQKLGHLVQNITTDVDYSARLFSILSSVMIAVVNLAVYTFLIFNISVPVAFLLVVLIFLIFFFLKPLFYKSRMLSAKLSLWYKNLSHFINQVVLGMKSVKSMSVEKKIIKEADKYFEDYRRITFRIALFDNFMNSITQPIGMLFVLAIFIFLYKFVGFNYGSFTVIIYAIYKVFTYLQNTQVQIQRMNTFAPYLINLLQYKEQTNNFYEKSEGGKQFIFNKDLKFQKVKFSYGGDKIVLDDVNMVFPKGEVTGIFGPSGSGKTTVVDLILRLYKEQGGKILLDEEEISQIDLEAWRNNIGYVSQDFFLINDTIENNIRFYRDNISYENIVEATKMSNIYEFIESLPEKFNTIVGERGILLSNGQRQRIVLARILSKRPNIIILDEATSALDSETEVFIQKAIEGLKGKMTVIVIAHRLSTIIGADKIYALKDGVIVEEGKPKELLSDKESYFYKMYSLKDIS